MNHAEFNLVLRETIEQMQNLSTVKGGEYAGDDDRLANFKRNALVVGVAPEVIWQVYTAKHWDSIMQYIYDIVSGKTRPRAESLAGRADDIIVYMVLFKCLLREREQPPAGDRNLHDHEWSKP